MKGFLRLLAWPFLALFRPSQQTVRSLRLSLYLCSAVGLLAALPAGWWCMGYLISLLPDLKRTMKEPSETVLVLIMVGSVVPFLLAAVLQLASALRVLRKLPDELQMTMPGLGLMKAVAPVTYLVFALVGLVLVANLTALGLMAAGFVVALVICAIYGWLTIISIDKLDPDVAMLDRMGQIIDVCTSSRHFFPLQTAVLDAADPPDWLITLLVLVAYAVPTTFAIVIWSKRQILVAAGGVRAGQPRSPSSASQPSP